MSKPDKQEKLTAILIIQNAVDHILSQPEYQELSDTVLAQIESYLAPLAKRKQALLSPAPKPPRKPVSRKQETEYGGNEVTVVPVPDGLKFDTDNAVLKRGKRK